MFSPASDRAAWRGPLLVLAGALCIAFAPIGARISEFGPQATAFWRFALALPLLACVVRGRVGRPSAVAICAGTFFGLDIALWHASLELTSVANATFLVNLGPVSAGLLAWLIFRERPSRAWPAAAAAAIGGAWMLSRGARAASPVTLQGDVLALAAAVMVSLYLITSKAAGRSLSVGQVMFWSTAAALCVAVVAVVLTGERLTPAEPSWLLPPLMLALLAQAAGQGLIVAGVGLTPTATAGLLLLVQPVASAAIAWAAFGETLTIVQAAGAALVLTGISLVRPRRAEIPSTSS
jgi:drug/metabolite transporter (DMT)-like permease